MSCPFLHKPAKGAGVPPNSVCPYADAMIAKANTDAPLTCPLGFGRASGSILSPLHCTHCRALLHAPVKVNACGHKFCKFCISKFQDCPLCGIDIDQLVNDSETDELVSKFLEVHAGNPALWSKLVGHAGGEDTSKSGFYLQLGMQSFAGGNLEAAISRLQLCKEELLQQQAAGSSITGGEATGPQPSETKPNQQQQQQQQPSTAAAAAPAPLVSSVPPVSSVPEDAAEPGGKPSDGDCSASGSCGPDVGKGVATAPGSRCPFHRGQTAPVAGASGGGSGTHKGNGTPGPAGTEGGSGQGSSGALSLSCKLGAVCGSLADCCKQLGDLEGAAGLYEESVGHLQPYAEGDQEVAHALSVSYNKQGDLYYMRDRLQQSRQCYMRALIVRQRSLAASGTGEDAAEQVLGLVVSSIKVADASKVLGDKAAADKYAGQARQLLQQQPAEKLPPHLAAKHQHLGELLQVEFAA